MARKEPTKKYELTTDLDPLIAEVKAYARELEKAATVAGYLMQEAAKTVDELHYTRASLEALNDTVRRMEVRILALDKRLCEFEQTIGRSGS